MYQLYNILFVLAIVMFSMCIRFNNRIMEISDNYFKFGKPCISEMMACNF